MAVKGITTNFLGGNLFDGWVDSDELAKVDQAESAARYAELFEERLLESYPGADIKVDYQLNASGSESPTYIDADDWREEQDAQTDVDTIAQALYEDYDAWVVAR